MAKRVQPASGNKLAEYISRQIDLIANERNQREIAEMLGYANANIISMFKRGDTKVPLEKIPDLANAINADPALLFRLALEQYWPELDRQIAEVFGAVVTKNERAWLDVIRAASKNSDPVCSEEQRTKLEALF